MTEIAKVMVSTTVEGTMTEIAGAMMGRIDMMTAEATTIIIKAVTNRDLMSEPSYTRMHRDNSDIKNDCPAEISAANCWTREK